MEKAKKQNMLIFIIRWIFRLASIGFAVLFIFFFIGEGAISNLADLGISEILLLVFIPLIFVIGIIVAFSREALGGIIMVLGVIGFNVVDMISSNGFSGVIEFWYLLIPGAVFIILGSITKRKA